MEQNENLLNFSAPARKKNQKSVNVFQIVLFVFLTLWSISMLYCLFWLVNNSLKDSLEYELDQVSFAKEPLKHLKTYLDVFSDFNVKNTNMVGMLWNTIWVTTGNIVLQVFSSVLFAYIVARYKFPGRDIIYWVIIVKMMLPIVGALPAQYKMYDALGMTNSPLFLILNLQGTANFLIYYAACKGLSSGYPEAAYLDGANHFTVFFKIMLPQLSGIITATVITSFIANWNEYMTFILFLDEFPSLATALYYYDLSKSDENYPLLLAAVTLSIIPVVVIFACFQKYFINIDISGGLKG